VLTISPRTGQGGRPRTFQDDDFFRATTRVILKQGYSGLTLGAVAEELGCTGAAVSRRFGSKRGLVAGYLDWTLLQVEQRYRQVREAYRSPLVALRARGTIPAGQRIEEIGDPSDPAQQANTGAFFASLRCDPAFRQILDRHREASEREAAEFLQAALDAGELIPCDPVVVGNALIAAWIGTTMYWPGDSVAETLVDRLGTIFDTIIGPYRAIAER
jgi:AcrR family transcriptional regulator